MGPPNDFESDDVENQVKIHYDVLPAHTEFLLSFSYAISLIKWQSILCENMHADSARHCIKTHKAEVQLKKLNLYFQVRSSGMPNCQLATSHWAEQGPGLPAGSCAAYAGQVLPPTSLIEFKLNLIARHLHQ
jgi:hypothetical protein